MGGACALSASVDLPCSTVWGICMSSNDRYLECFSVSITLGFQEWGKKKEALGSLVLDVRGVREVGQE